MDNRPLKFEEFVERIGQTVYLSATPGPYELQQAAATCVEQVIRPTGLIDPEVVVKPTKGQIDDLVHEIRLRAERDERVLVTTLTKKMSEDLTDYLLELGHPGALPALARSTRCAGSSCCASCGSGEYDVLVGINLLREGLDLPEVSLVAILDADKEGFLRSGTSLIQTIGRAARNVSGQVHMYADKITPSMQQAIDETNRRREQAGRLQHRARHRPAAAAQADRRHHRPARPRGRGHRAAASAAAGGSSRAARRRCRACPRAPARSPRRRAGAPRGRADQEAVPPAASWRPDPAAQRADARRGARSCSSSWRRGSATRSAS